jgi:hypothetical protein
VTDESVLCLAAHCPMLSAVDLAGCDRITDAGIEALIRPFTLVR